MTFALGKKPARTGAVKLRFETYFDAASLPVPPTVFGRPWLVPTWGMLGNATIGDCVWAAAAHQTMLWNAEAGNPIPPFTDACVLGDYAAETQKDDPPGYPTVDAGTDLQQAAAYRSKTGIADAAGQRHLTGPYVALQPGDIDQLALAAYLFGAISVGIQLPTSAFDQFDRAEPWEPVQEASIEGGHCISLCGRNSRGMLLAVTWGRLQAVSPTFLAQYMDEGVAHLSIERLKGNISPQGFNEAALQADLALIQGATSVRRTVMADTSTPSGIDPGEIIAAKAAIKQYVSDHIPSWAASYVTDQEETDIATAVVTAVETYRSGQEI
jgi:hypothetical protein